MLASSRFAREWAMMFGKKKEKIMKYLSVLLFATLILSVAWSEQDHEPPTGKVKPPTSTLENSSVDWHKENQLVVQAPTPGTSRSKDRQRLNARYTLNAKNAGKLLIRVSDSSLMTPPWSWGNATGSVESDGFAQRVLQLSSEDLATPLAIEARVVHQREPEETVRVEFTVYRDNKAENWFNFYQCRPARNTTRSSYGGTHNTDGDPVVIDSGEITTLWSFRFGGEGDPTGVESPLSKGGMQAVMICLGWKSNND